MACERLDADGAVFLDDEHPGTVRDRVEDLASEAEGGGLVFPAPEAPLPAFS